jgi:DNA (cytosine-5)-methyltransferase 1
MRHGRGVADTLTAQTRTWTTPQVQDGKQGGPSGCAPSSRDRDLLTAEVVRWPTPIQGDAHLSSTPEAAQRRLDEGKTTLSRSFQAWPIATAGDASSNGNRNLEGSSAHAGTSLTDAVNGGQRPRVWATVAAHEARLGFQDRSNPDKRETQESTTTQACKEASVTSGALNPDWVACLMGWPVGWEDASKPLPQPVTFAPWPAPPGPQHPWEPPRLTARIPGRTARLRMLGNGQVPATAVLAWRILSGGRT